MDTIGDAYIVAAFLPPADPASPAGAHKLEVRRVCRDVLEVSRAMLRGIQSFRGGDGQALHCRIGISLGTVMTGVLGRLQPRLHLFGEGMRAAESHEQAGEADAVHVNFRFMRALGRRTSESACLDAVVPYLRPPTPTHHMGSGIAWLGALPGDSGLYNKGGHCADNNTAAGEVVMSEEGSEAGAHKEPLELQMAPPQDPVTPATPFIPALQDWVVVETAAPSADENQQHVHNLRTACQGGNLQRCSFVLYPGKPCKSTDSLYSNFDCGRAGSTALLDQGPGC